MSDRLVACLLLWMLGGCSAPESAPLPTPSQVEPAPTTDSSSPVGVWYLNLSPRLIGKDTVGTRAILTIKTQGSGYLGTLKTEADNKTLEVSQIRWTPADRILEFGSGSVNGPYQWFRGRIVEGVFVGRYSRSLSPSKPVLTEYSRHVAGWSSTYLDHDLIPRIFELVISGSRVRLRIDRIADGSNGFQGTSTAYVGVDGTKILDPEFEIGNVQWNGSKLTYRLYLYNRQTQTSTTVDGRSIVGQELDSGSFFDIAGVRGEVLSLGQAPLDALTRGVRQERARRQLSALIMAGNPAPLSTAVSESAASIQTSQSFPPERDDDPLAHPQNYSVSELQFSFRIPDSYSDTPISRSAHGYLALPSSPLPPSGKRPAALVLNGHGGSAYRTLNPNDAANWYGDAFARRGYIVLSLDVGHRPTEDRAGLYSDVLLGDDPGNGNGLHPAIKSAQMDTDWEEDGERAWDGMRALDYLLSRPDVDPQRLLVVGQDMGSEVAMVLSALDTRPALTVSSLFVSDLQQTHYNDGNHLCFLWANADAHEYIDTSVLYSLVAPRPLILMTGATDTTYSRVNPPFTGAKQVAKRARAIYGADADRLVHYLHSSGHVFRVGEKNPTAGNAGVGVQVPLLTGPASPVDNQTYLWQSNSQTQTVSDSLFTLIGTLLSQSR